MLFHPPAHTTNLFPQTHILSYSAVTLCPEAVLNDGSFSSAHCLHFICVSPHDLLINASLTFSFLLSTLSLSLLMQLIVGLVPYNLQDGGVLYNLGKCICFGMTCVSFNEVVGRIGTRRQGDLADSFSIIASS